MPTTEEEETKYRLPTNVRPTHYDVTVQTDLEKLTFRGFVKIRYALFLLSLSLAESGCQP